MRWSLRTQIVGLVGAMLVVAMGAYLLLAMRVIVFGQSLEDTRRETELFVMNGICTI